MNNIKYLFWILLVNSVSILNSSHKTNADGTSSMSLFVGTPKGMCDPATDNITTMQDSSSTTSRFVNFSCASHLSEDTDETIDVDDLKKIEFYYHLAEKIGRISPPILIGKTSL